MRIKIQLIVASFKMFVRQREALIWTIVLPLFMVFLFSFVKFDGLGTIPLGIVSSSGDTSFVHTLRMIKTFKISSTYINFAPHLEGIGEAPRFDGFRDVLDGADIGGDVFAFVAVAAGGGLHELAAFVAESDREPIDLGLGREG